MKCLKNIVQHVHGRNVNIRTLFARHSSINKFVYFSMIIYYFLNTFSIINYSRCFSQEKYFENTLIFWQELILKTLSVINILSSIHVLYKCTYLHYKMRWAYEQFCGIPYASHYCCYVAFYRPFRYYIHI